MQSGFKFQSWHGAQLEIKGRYSSIVGDKYRNLTVLSGESRVWHPVSTISHTTKFLSLPSLTHTYTRTQKQTFAGHIHSCHYLFVLKKPVNIILISYFLRMHFSTAGPNFRQSRWRLTSCFLQGNIYASFSFHFFSKVWQNIFRKFKKAHTYTTHNDNNIWITCFKM